MNRNIVVNTRYRVCCRRVDPFSTVPLLLPKGQLETCDTITVAEIDGERWAEHEPVMGDMVENVDSNGGNVNVLDADEDKLMVTSDKLGTALELGGGAALITEAM